MSVDEPTTELTATAEPAPAAPAPSAPSRSRRSRLARFGFLAAGLAAAVFILPRLPHDHAVTYRLDDASVRSIDVSWSRVGDDGAQSGEPVRGASYRFEAGRAPRSIDASVKLPNGRYQVSVRIADDQGSRAFERAITVDDAGPITIPLR